MAYPDIPIWLELARLGRDFTLSGFRSLLPNPDVSNIERYCLFMGAPRNGHSLVGALLDAHPEMVIAYELGVPKYTVAHFSKRQIELLMLSNSKQHALKGRRHIHYSHTVPDQWQGRYKELRVLGDKHGEGFLLSVRARPWLTDALMETLKPCHFIHVIRNPYDAIASIVCNKKRQHTLDSAIAYFEILYETLNMLSEKFEPGQLHEIHFEHLLSQAKKELADACSFLGVEAGPGYLESCISIVIDKPEDLRGLVQWDRSSRKNVDALIDKYPFFSKYNFEQAGF